MHDFDPNFCIEEIGKTDKGKKKFGPHYFSLRHIGKRFNEVHGDRLLVDITKKDVMRIIEDINVSKVSKISYRQAQGDIFSYAVERAEIYEKISGIKLNVKLNVQNERDNIIDSPPNSNNVPYWSPKISLDQGIMGILHNEL